VEDDSSGRGRRITRTSRGVQGAGCKTKIVKRRFQDQEDARTTPEDENSIEGACCVAAAPAAGAAEAAPPTGGEEPPAAAVAAAAAVVAAPSPSGKAAGRGQEGW
jgi:hypothetical protein